MGAHKQIIIIGGGPGGLMAAEVLAGQGHAVTIYDRMPSAGRKFLMAGRGGLNLTHSEPLEKFINRYGDAAPRLSPIIHAFPPEALRAWCEELGQPTFVGSSGRVFPQSFKASPLLRAWLQRLTAQGVRFVLNRRFTGWSEQGALQFQSPDGATEHAAADAVLLAMGGASWPRLGSDGLWAGILQNRNIPVTDLRPANCGFTTDWSHLFRQRFAGHPLKSVTLTSGDARIRGEMVLTSTGVEGGGIYALSASLRQEIETNGVALLKLDLKPDITTDDLTERLSAPRGRQSFSNHLRKVAGLSSEAIGLLQEVTRGDASGMPTKELAALVKCLPLRLNAPCPLDRAISTAGGIALDALDDNFMLRALPGVFAAGEMLDWEAPTGGYLLQATFATARHAALGMGRWLTKKTPANLEFDF